MANVHLYIVAVAVNHPEKKHSPQLCNVCDIVT